MMRAIVGMIGQAHAKTICLDAMIAVAFVTRSSAADFRQPRIQPVVRLNDDGWRALSQAL